MLEYVVRKREAAERGFVSVGGREWVWDDGRDGVRRWCFVVMRVQVRK